MKKHLPKKSCPNNKFLFGLLLAILILGLLYFWLVIKQKSAAKKNSVLQAASFPGSLFLSPATSVIDAGQAVDLTVTMDTGGTSASGADVVIQYEPTRFDINSITPSAETIQTTGLKTFAPVVSESDLNFSWQKAVNTSTGIIDFSAVAFDQATSIPTSSFNGNTSLATLTFQAKPVRSNTFSSVNFSTELGITTDSNISVIDTATVGDVLGTTNHAVIKVMAEPICRAAIDTTDQIPGLNDLVWLISKWGTTCSGCDEDLDANTNIGLGDLVYVIGYWGQTCPVAP